MTFLKRIWWFFTRRCTTCGERLVDRHPMPAHYVWCPVCDKTSGDEHDD